MIFAILSGEALEIRDPETNEVLDVIEREKVKVKATEVRDKITICKTYRITKVPAGSLYFSLNPLSSSIANSMRPPKEIVETLEAKNSALPPPLSPEESYVKINDRAVQIEGDE